MALERQWWCIVTIVVFVSYCRLFIFVPDASVSIVASFRFGACERLIREPGNFKSEASDNIIHSFIDSADVAFTRSDSSFIRRSLFVVITFAKQKMDDGECKCARLCGEAQQRVHRRQPTNRPTTRSSDRYKSEQIRRTLIFVERQQKALLIVIAAADFVSTDAAVMGGMDHSRRRRASRVEVSQQAR